MPEMFVQVVFSGEAVSAPPEKVSAQRVRQLSA
jgi:hypothetical protein